jgi:D-alanine-D-alanine ligase
MKVTILHNEPGPDAGPDEADVLVQAAAVEGALRALGHAVERLGCGLDLAALAAALGAGSPDVVFNLAEGLAGHDRLFAVVPSLLDALRVPYTGCPAEAVFLTTHKLLAKERLAASGLPTPPVGARWPPAAAPQAAEPFAPGVYIAKPVWEHGSLGMRDDAVVAAADRDELLAAVRGHAGENGREWFAERFVAGRELNLSLLEGASGPGSGPGSAPEVLPPAEIDFSRFPPGKPRIVGWAAKWAPGSFEYEHTPRRFDHPSEDAPLLARVSSLALACWDLFGLRGYARVDFRVDAAGEPWILEVNTNPCLSPDAGFAAAVERAGLGYAEAIGRILAATGARE